MALGEYNPQDLRALPVEHLVSIAPGQYSVDEVRAAGDEIAERQELVLSFFRQMDAHELFSIMISPLFRLRYNPVAWLGIKKAFIERKEEMLKQLEKFELSIAIFEETAKEQEDALIQNIEWPSLEERHKDVLAALEDKQGWFANVQKWLLKRKLNGARSAPPDQLDEHAREWLEKNIAKQRSTIAEWRTETKPMLLDLLNGDDEHEEHAKASRIR